MSATPAGAAPTTDGAWARPARPAAPGERRPGVYALRVLAVAAVVALLYGARDVLVPATFSLTLAILLVPVVERLRRWHLPAVVAAAVAVIGTLALLVGIGIALEPPLRRAAEAAPNGIAAARARLEQLRAPLERLGRKLESQPAPPPGGPQARLPAATGPAATGPSPRDSAIAGSAKADSTSGTRAAGPTNSIPAGMLSAARRAFGASAGLIGELVEVLLLTLFLLAPGSRWSEKLDTVVRSPDTRRTVRTAADEVRAVVTRYVVASLLINASQGVLIALATWALGLPAPLLWGVLTALLELIPYIGGFMMVAMLFVVGLATGGSLTHAFLPPLVYLVVTTLQNNLVSPAAYGRGLQLNPAVILLATMVGFALWGVAGALLAVPIVASLRVVASHVAALEPVAVFLEP
ncbi:AI-2E family transporter [Gemmatimonadetes bacterium T265]|nr:AI-2E family transporter [Gemmatimonadetes bacterium T265]